MSLQYILNRVSRSQNIDLTDEGQRSWLVDIINEAADEVYSEKDLPLVLKECTVRVLNDYRIALPAFVGVVRAIRSTKYNDLWTLKDVRARFNSVDWPERWNKGRIIGESPIAVDPTSTSPGTLEIHEADSDCTVTLVGSTINSNRESDTVTMDDTEKDWSLSFQEIKAIRKNIVTDHDIVIKDADGNEISILYADQKEARYILMDISEFPGFVDCADGSFMMEVLFKPRLPRMERDEDSFPLQGYDDIIILRTKQLLAEEEEGKESRALLMNEKSKQKLRHKIDDQVGTTEKRIFYKRRPMQGYFRRHMFNSKA